MPQAEACFQKALGIARHQPAKAWKLRTATSLSRLWLLHGKRNDARELLVPVYTWFTEGFDTAFKMPERCWTSWPDKTGMPNMPLTRLTQPGHTEHPRYLSFAQTNGNVLHADKGLECCA